MGGVGMEKSHLQQQVLPIGEGGLQGAPQAGGTGARTGRQAACSCWPSPPVKDPTRQGAGLGQMRGLGWALDPEPGSGGRR
jgi:hypothetical protein